MCFCLLYCVVYDNRMTAENVTICFLLDCVLTDEEVWEKLSSYVNEEIKDDDDDNNNNNDDNDYNVTHETARAGERHCADCHSTTQTTLLGKRHSADHLSSLSKRRCAEAEERHSADCELTIETTLLGERHSADSRGINVLGAVPSNTSLRTVFRSLSRGIIRNLRLMSPPSQKLAGLRRIIGSGGALMRNSVMCKAVKDLYNLPLVINGKSDTGDSAVGAAIAAGRFL